jgi:hypothetical protein
MRYKGIPATPIPYRALFSVFCDDSYLILPHDSCNHANRCSRAGINLVSHTLPFLATP